MENNEEQNVIDKAKEAMIAAEEASKLAANIASGNFIGAAKNAVHLLKNKEFKKKIKKKIIMSLLKCMIPVIIAVCLLCGIMAIKDTMVGLLANAGTAISGFLSEAWQWMTNDYWIKLDEKIEYTIDADTGETLGTPTTITDEDLKDENGNQRNTTTESYTIVDKYIKELGNQGLSLKALRLLGDADYSDEEKLLENEDNKTLVEKYISEFIRADIITQQPHKNRTEELVNPKNQNWVDGGVYFYRTKKEPTIDEDKFINGEYNSTDEPVTDKDYKQMEFMNYDEFMERLAKNDKDLRYNFTIDKKTGELIVAEIIETKTANATVPTDMGWFNEIAAWFNQQFKTTTKYELKEKRIDYREYISKYAMPYEFLINLCEITQNPEFVYHVALLARNTKIILVIQDNTTVERETIEVLKEETTYVSSTSSMENASENKETEKTRTVTMTTTQTPVLEVEYADTWSFYEEFEYTKNVEGKLKEEGPTVNEYTSALFYYPAHTEIHYSFEGVEVPVTVPDQYVKTKTREETSTQTVTITTTYNEPILKNSVEKSKQFLGLLRNDTGKCNYNCSNETVSLKYDPTALKCAQKAEFNRKGINVQYRIPNMTRTESPLNKLTSGIQMLYAALQSNSSGYKEEDKLISNEQISESYEIQEQYIADKDYESAYVVKMQGLVEHMRYLMTFPENETYTINGLTESEDDNNEEYEEVTDDELELLYRVCEAEAGGSSEDEIGHVASVVLNRVNSPKWPNTIKGVVYQDNQFSCVKRADFDKIVPSEKTKRAVDYVVANGDTTGGAYYYRTEESAKQAGMPTSPNETHATYVYLFKDPNTHIFYTDKSMQNGIVKKDSYIVAIDAGHGVPTGDYATGTAATYKGVYYTEWEWNRKVADMVYQKLSANPKITPIRIGNSAANPKLGNDERVPMAMKANADLYVSIHFNSAASSSARGSEVVINSGDDQATRQFAQIMTDSLYNSLGYESLGVKKRKINDSTSWEIVWRRSKSGFPGIITEGCFMSNSEDMKLMVEGGGLEKYAQGVVNGILTYLGV